MKYLNAFLIVLSCALSSGAEAKYIDIRFNAIYNNETNGTGVSTSPPDEVARLVMEQKGDNVVFSLRNTWGSAQGFGNSAKTGSVTIGYDKSGSSLGPGITLGDNPQHQFATGYSYQQNKSGFAYALTVTFPKRRSESFMDQDLAVWVATNTTIDDYLIGGSKGGDEFLAAIHIQSLASGGSIKFVGTAVPEPDSLAILAFGLLLLGFSVHARRGRTEV